jgi:hypothetical protein
MAHRSPRGVPYKNVCCQVNSFVIQGGNGLVEHATHMTASPFSGKPRLKAGASSLPRAFEERDVEARPATIPDDARGLEVDTRIAGRYSG